jgi:hypothetical protein
VNGENMVNLFKSVVVFSYCLYAVSFFLPVLYLFQGHQETNDALSWTGHGAVIEIHYSIGWMVFLAYSITLYGMINFKSWSRPLFVALIALSILLTGIQGINVLTAIDDVLSHLTNLADGATIILMYFTSVSNKFSKNT